MGEINIPADSITGEVRGEGLHNPYLPLKTVFLNKKTCF